jgi:DNA-binding GntR family transcriptional regulator
MRNRVYAQIREAIVSGKLGPGTVVTLRSLAGLLGTSAMPVREAVMRLVSEGAVELHPNRTFSIVKLSPTRFSELQAIRTTLEGWAAEVAAERMTKEEIAQVRAISKKMEKEAHQSGENYLLYNREFHFTIYRATRMMDLVNTIESLWMKYGPSLNYFSKADGARHEGNKVHRKIIDAIARQDGPAARLAMQEDIRSAAEVILPRLVDDQVGERKSLGTNATKPR